MILKYGTYAHAQNEAAVVISKRPVYSPRGFRQGVRETWHVSGLLHAHDQLELTLALAALRTAYNVNGLDVGLYLDDGTTLTDHAMTSTAALGGVRVTRFDFPQGTGAQYSTFRTYSLTLEADFPDTAINLIEYDEALSLEGTGGPRRVFIDTLEGNPQEQLGQQRTTYRATQSGRAVGRAAYPAIPPPIWPDAEREEHRRITMHAPDRVASNLTRYAIDWSYTFESSVPLRGSPTMQ